MFKGRTVLVAGCGKSGIASAKLLIRAGADVILYDENENLDTGRVLGNFKDPSNLRIVAGGIKDDIIQSVDLMVLSPGIAIDAPFVNRVRDAGVKIWGEVELAYRVARGRLVAITGTNGKTTTTTLTGEIMKAAFSHVDVVGNIGTPYTETAFDSTDDTVTVAEISSFQLESIHSFHPEVCAVLNISPDHLNRHYTMENYVNVKMRVAKNQTERDVCVLNYEDSYLRERAKELKSRAVFFSSRRELKEGVFLDGENIIYRHNGGDTFVASVKDTSLVGMHNIENIMAAAAVSLGMGVSSETVRKVVKNFKAVEHRIEYVAEKNGVVYYNDSKGTNTDASVKAIEAMDRPTVLIAGGYDKKVSFDSWVEAFGGKIKALVLIGDTADKIEQTAREHGFTRIIRASSLKEAVVLSAGEASENDAVLLSPACASWDMFDNYEQRGDLFKQYVSELK